MLGLLQELFHWGCHSFLSCLYKLHQITIKLPIFIRAPLHWRQLEQFDANGGSQSWSANEADAECFSPECWIFHCLFLGVACKDNLISKPLQRVFWSWHVSRISNPVDRIVISYWLCWLWCIFSNALEDLLLHCRTRWSIQMLASSAFFSWASST